MLRCLLAALSVSQLCSGLSKQDSSQKLLPGFTEQEVDCFVSQGEPLRPQCCCLPLVWLWTLQLVRAVSRPVGNLWKEKDQKILRRVSGVNIHPRIKPTYRRKVEAASVLIKYSVFWLVFGWHICNCRWSEWWILVVNVECNQEVCLLACHYILKK